jgi:hypothetical protein
MGGLKAMFYNIDQGGQGIPVSSITLQARGKPAYLRRARFALRFETKIISIAATRRSVDRSFEPPLGFFEHFVTACGSAGDRRGHTHIRDNANALGGTTIRVENASVCECHPEIARENNLRNIPVGASCIASDDQNSCGAPQRHGCVFDIALCEFVYQNNDL